MPRHPSGAKLDDRDRQILAELGANAWLSYAELARRVFLSASATQRRVERLIATGAIMGARTIVSSEALGRPLRLFVLLQLRDGTGDKLRNLARRLMSTQIVVEAHYVTGESDVLLVLQASSMDEYSAFVERYLNQDANIFRFRTLTSMRALKGCSM